MQMRVNAATALLVCALLTGCGGGANRAAPTPARGVAYLRFVNGSSDIETVNPQAPPGAGACNFSTTDAVLGALVSVNVNGAQAVASFPYGSISAYVAVNAAPAQISVVRPSAVVDGCPNLTFSTDALTDNSYHTIVVGGRYGDGTLNFILYSDTMVSGSAAQFYNAAPSVATANVGTFTPGQPQFRSAGAVVYGAAAPIALTDAAQPPGTGFFATPSGGATLTILPSSIDRYDTANVVPFNNETHISIFLVDGDPESGSSAPKLLGAFQ